MDYILAGLTALLGCFSFPNFIETGLTVHTSFLVWIAFVPVLTAALKSHSLKKAFLISFVSVSLFYLISLYWLQNVGPMGAFAYVAWVILCLYLSIWFSAAVLLSKYLETKKGITPFLTLPVLLTFSEYVREWFFTGFPLLTPAQAVHDSLFLDGLVKTAGSHGANFLIYSVNAVIAALIAGRCFDLKRRDIRIFLSAVMVGIVLCMTGFIPERNEKRNIKAAILQPDIDQNVQWDAQYVNRTMSTFYALIDTVKNESPDVYIWPETGFPGVLTQRKEAAAAIAKRSGAYSIIGSDEVKYEGTQALYYNGAYALSPAGELTGSYYKFHLVPFGEYVPLSDVFVTVKKVVQRYGFSGFERGRLLAPLHTGDIKAGAMICYDSLFPEIARGFARADASYLAHLSYETWYGRTPASAQIFQNTALRAKETGLPVIRCVASGISGTVDARGRINICAGLFKAAACVENVELQKTPVKTPYTKFGDWFPFALLFMLLLALLEKKNDNIN